MGKLYDQFELTAKRFTADAIEEINDEISYLNLHVEYVPDYDFTDLGWLAVYIHCPECLDEGVIQISVNYPLMFEMMKKRRIHKDIFNIEAQCRINIAHEAGHGIIDWIRNNIDPDELSPDSALYKVYHVSPEDEEEIVEEFGQSFFPEATGIYSSFLDIAIQNLRDYIITI